MAEEEKKVAKEKIFPMIVNEARGEVPLWVGDVPLVIAAELGRLSALSARLQCKSLSDLYSRLSDVEVSATVAAIELLTVRGKPLEALSQLKIKHFGACRVAFLATLAHHLDEDETEGNEEAADQAA